MVMKNFMKVFAVASMLMFTISCDALEDVLDCVEQFAEYTDEAAKYAQISGSVCDNQQAAQDFITFLETEAKGSCIEDELSKQGESLDDIIADAKAELAKCTN